MVLGYLIAGYDKVSALLVKLFIWCGIVVLGYLIAGYDKVSALLVKLFIWCGIVSKRPNITR